MNHVEPIHPALSRAYGDRGYSSEAIRQHLAAKARRERMDRAAAVAFVALPAPEPIPEPKAPEPVAPPAPKEPMKWSSDRATRRKQIDEVLNAASMRERPPIEPPKVKSRAARVVLRAAGETMLRETAEAYNLTLAQMLGTSHRNQVVAARHEAMSRMRRELSLSYPDIARVFKRNDHVAVMMGVSAHACRVASLKARIEASA